MTQSSVFTTNIIILLVVLTVFVQQAISVYFITKYPLQYFSQRPFIIALTNIPLLIVILLIRCIRPIHN
jgi:hypothetical protein